MKIGFIGVGNIGAPIAGQLLKAGYELVIHDRRREAVCTCLPGPKKMEEVCLGEGALVVSLRPGALYIDHTTNAPALVRRVHTLLAEKGVGMVDAPVSGGMEGA